MKGYIYFLVNEKNECLYIGKTGDIRGRMSQHYKKRAFNRCTFFEVNNTLILDVMEMYFISRYNPLENIEYKDIGPTSPVKYFDEILKNNSYQYHHYGRHEKIASLELVERERTISAELQNNNYYVYEIYKMIDGEDIEGCLLKKVKDLVEIGFCCDIDAEYQKLMRKVKSSKIEHDFAICCSKPTDRVDAYLQYIALSLKFYKDPEMKHIKGVAEFIGEYVDPLNFVDEYFLISKARYGFYTPESLSFNCNITDERVITKMLGLGELVKTDKSCSVSYDKLITSSLQKTLTSKHRLEDFTYVIALVDKYSTVIDYGIFNPEYPGLSDYGVVKLARDKAIRIFEKYLLIKGVESIRESLRAEVDEKLKDIIEVREYDKYNRRYYIDFDIYFVNNGSELDRVEYGLFRAMNMEYSAKLGGTKVIRSKIEIFI